MDWRYRDYFGVFIEHRSRTMRYEYFRWASDKLKMHSISSERWHELFERTKCSFDVIISCPKEDSGALEYELNKAERRDDYSSYIKLSKEIMGQ